MNDKKNEVPETEHEKALADVTAAQWKRYQDVFVPIENKYLSDIQQTPADEAIVAGQVGAGVGRQLGMARQKAERDLFASGINPASGKFKSAVGGFGIDRGNIAGSAMARGTQAVDDRTLLGLENAINLGRGQAGEAMQDMSLLSSNAAREAIEKAQSEAKERETLGSSISTTAGMGLAGWNYGRQRKEKENTL